MTRIIPRWQGESAAFSAPAVKKIAPNFEGKENRKVAKVAKMTRIIPRWQGESATFSAPALKK